MVAHLLLLSQRILSYGFVLPHNLLSFLPIRKSPFKSWLAYLSGSLSSFSDAAFASHKDIN